MAFLVSGIKASLLLVSRLSESIICSWFAYLSAYSTVVAKPDYSEAKIVLAMVLALSSYLRYTLLICYVRALRSAYLRGGSHILVTS